jgi:NTE family protein
LTQPPLPDFRPRIEDSRPAVMTRTGQKTAFAFAGGGSLGAIQVGMLRVLLSAGVQPDFVVGASVGAINAAYFAGAPNADGVERLAEIWSGLRRGDVFPVTFKSAFGLLRHPDSVIDSGGLRHLIETNLAYARLEDAAIPIHVTATDVEGMAVILSKGPAIDAILASAAIPGVFPPVRIDGQTLMDGAIARNSPIRVAADLGAPRIVVLPTGYACTLKELPKGAIARVLHAITLLIEWRLIHDIERLADEVEVCIVPTLCPLDVSPYDFSASGYLIQRAEESTRRWLDGGGLSRRSRSQELEAHRH